MIILWFFWDVKIFGTQIHFYSGSWCPFSILSWVDLINVDLLQIFFWWFSISKRLRFLFVWWSQVFLNILWFENRNSRLINLRFLKSIESSLIWFTVFWNHTISWLLRWGRKFLNIILFFNALVLIYIWQ